MGPPLKSLQKKGSVFITFTFTYSTREFLHIQSEPMVYKPWLPLPLCLSPLFPFHLPKLGSNSCCITRGPQVSPEPSCPRIPQSHRPHHSAPLPGVGGGIGRGTVRGSWRREGKPQYSRGSNRKAKRGNRAWSRSPGATV